MFRHLYKISQQSHKSGPTNQYAAYGRMHSTHRCLIKFLNCPRQSLVIATENFRRYIYAFPRV
jgi:hypothetical protein